MTMAMLQRRANVSIKHLHAIWQIVLTSAKPNLTSHICVLYIINVKFLLKVRLPPEVNRVLYIRNLPYKITAEEMYDIFGKYGAIRQIRV